MGDQAAGWTVAESGRTVNVYDATGRRVLAVVEIADGLAVRTCRNSVVPMSVLREAIVRADGLAGA